MRYPHVGGCMLRHTTRHPVLMKHAPTIRDRSAPLMTQRTRSKGARSRTGRPMFRRIRLCRAERLILLPRVLHLRPLRLHLQRRVVRRGRRISTRSIHRQQGKLGHDLARPVVSTMAMTGMRAVINSGGR